MRRFGHFILALALFVVQPMAPVCTQGESLAMPEITSPTSSDTSESPSTSVPFVEIEVHEFVGHLMHASAPALILSPLIEARGLLVHELPNGITFPPLQRPPRA